MKSSVNILGASGSNAKKRGSNNPVNNNSTGKQPQSAQPASQAASQPLITAPATNNTSNNKKGESGQVKQNGSGSISGNANNNTNGHSSSHIHTAEISLLLKNQASKRNRQENQLTWMSIVVGKKETRDLEGILVNKENDHITSPI